MANNGSLRRSENDPGVMSHLVKQLGLARFIGFHDVYSIVTEVVSLFLLRHRLLGLKLSSESPKKFTCLSVTNIYNNSVQQHSSVFSPLLRGPSCTWCGRIGYPSRRPHHQRLT